MRNPNRMGLMAASRLGLSAVKRSKFSTQHTAMDMAPWKIKTTTL